MLKITPLVAAALLALSLPLIAQGGWAGAPRHRR